MNPPLAPPSVPRWYFYISKILKSFKNKYIGRATFGQAKFQETSPSRRGDWMDDGRIVSPQEGHHFLVPVVVMNLLDGWRRGGGGTYAEHATVIGILLH